MTLKATPACTSPAYPGPPPLATDTSTASQSASRVTATTTTPTIASDCLLTVNAHDAIASRGCDHCVNAHTAKTILQVSAPSDTCISPDVTDGVPAVHTAGEKLIISRERCDQGQDIVHTHTNKDYGAPASQRQTNIIHTSASSQSVVDESQSPSSFTLSIAPNIPSLSLEYWDLSTMAPLNSRSLNAISRLQRYLSPNFPLWHSIPACRRAGVLILLYPDQVGDLRVVLTMRAAGLRNFSGHAAFPGGKADDTEETPYQIARREAWEEIGLPQSNDYLPQGYDIKQLCYLPHALARTDVLVRPCVAILDRITPTSCPSAPAVADALRPTPHAGEVAAVFSAPLHNFLLSTDETPSDGSELPPGPFYDGSWTNYDGQPWRVHNFYVPITNQRVTKPAPQPFASRDPALEHEKRLAENADVLEEHPGRYKVWGMTAKILVEAARLAYAEVPEMEHNEHFGDEELAMRAAEEGRFFDRKRRKHAQREPEKKKSIAHILQGWRQPVVEESAKM